MNKLDLTQDDIRALQNHLLAFCASFYTGSGRWKLLTEDYEYFLKSRRIPQYSESYKTLRGFAYLEIQRSHDEQFCLNLLEFMLSRIQEVDFGDLLKKKEYAHLKDAIIAYPKLLGLGGDDFWILSVTSKMINFIESLSVNKKIIALSDEEKRCFHLYDTIEDQAFVCFRRSELSRNKFIKSFLKIMPKEEWPKDFRRYVNYYDCSKQTSKEETRYSKGFVMPSKMGIYMVGYLGRKSKAVPRNLDGEGIKVIHLPVSQSPLDSKTLSGLVLSNDLSAERAFQNSIVLVKTEAKNHKKILGGTGEFTEGELLKQDADYGEDFNRVAIDRLKSVESIQTDNRKSA